MADNLMELIQETIAEDMAAIQEVFNEDIQPMLKAIEEQNKKEFDRELEETEQLEEES